MFLSTLPKDSFTDMDYSDSEIHSLVTEFSSRNNSHERLEIMNLKHLKHDKKESELEKESFENLQIENTNVAVQVNSPTIWLSQVVLQVPSSRMHAMENYEFGKQNLAVQVKNDSSSASSVERVFSLNMTSDTQIVAKSHENTTGSSMGPVFYTQAFHQTSTTFKEYFLTFIIFNKVH
jgi:hypothetical protein